MSKFEQEFTVASLDFAPPNGYQNRHFNNYNL